MSGGDSEEVTPVPIPNTEVKLFSANGSWDFVPVRVGRCQAMNKTPFYALVKESRGFLFGSFVKNLYTHLMLCMIFGGLAQLGEHLPYKQGVGGSIPSSSTIVPV